MGEHRDQVVLRFLASLLDQVREHLEDSRADLPRAVEHALGAALPPFLLDEAHVVLVHVEHLVEPARHSSAWPSGKPISARITVGGSSPAKSST